MDALNKRHRLSSICYQFPIGCQLNLVLDFLTIPNNIIRFYHAKEASLYKILKNCQHRVEMK